MRVKPLLLGLAAYLVASLAGIIVLAILLLFIGGNSVDSIVDSGTSTPFTVVSNIVELIALGFAGWVSSWISESHKLRYALGTGLLILFMSVLVSVLSPFGDPWWMWCLIIPVVMSGAYLDWKSVQ